MNNVGWLPIKEDRDLTPRFYSVPTLPGEVLSFFRPSSQTRFFAMANQNSDEPELIPTDLTVQLALPVAVAEIDRQADY